MAVGRTHYDLLREQQQEFDKRVQRARAALNPRTVPAGPAQSVPSPFLDQFRRATQALAPQQTQKAPFENPAVPEPIEGIGIYSPELGGTPYTPPEYERGFFGQGQRERERRHKAANFERFNVDPRTVQPGDIPWEFLDEELQGLAKQDVSKAHRALAQRYDDFRETPYGTIRENLIAGTGQAVSGLGKGLNYLGRLTGEQDTLLHNAGQAMVETGDQMQGRAVNRDLPEYEGYEFLLDPDWWMTEGVRSVPTNVGFTLLGGALGAPAAALGTAGRWIVAGVGARAVEGLMEAGNAYEQALTQGMEEEQAKDAATEVYAKNMSLAGLDAAQLAASFARIPPGMKQAVTKALGSKLGKAGVGIGRVAFAGATEGLEEVGQGNITGTALGEDRPPFYRPDQFTGEQRQEFGLGAAAGGVTAAPGAAYDATASDRLSGELQRTVEAMRKAAPEAVQEQQQPEPAPAAPEAEAPVDSSNTDYFLEQRGDDVASALRDAEILLQQEEQRLAEQYGGTFEPDMIAPEEQRFLNGLREIRDELHARLPQAPEAPPVEPVVEPVVEPEPAPVAQPEPVPEPVVQPEPEPEPEPAVVEPEPEPVPPAPEEQAEISPEVIQSIAARYLEDHDNAEDAIAALQVDVEVLEETGTRPQDGTLTDYKAALEVMRRIQGAVNPEPAPEAKPQPPVVQAAEEPPAPEPIVETEEPEIPDRDVTDPYVQAIGMTREEIAVELGVNVSDLEGLSMDELLDALAEGEGGTEDYVGDDLNANDLLAERRSQRITRVTPPAASAPGAPKLPAELAKAAPRYSYGDKRFTLQFANDVDRALYIVAQPKPSKRDADYLAFLQGVFPGKSVEELRADGAKVREAIKQLAKDATPGPLQVPVQAAAPEAAAPPKPKPKPKPEKKAEPKVTLKATYTQGEDLYRTAVITEPGGPEFKVEILLRKGKTGPRVEKAAEQKKLALEQYRQREGRQVSKAEQEQAAFEQTDLTHPGKTRFRDGELDRAAAAEVDGLARQLLAQQDITAAEAEQLAMRTLFQQGGVYAQWVEERRPTDWMALKVELGTDELAATSEAATDPRDKRFGALGSVYPEVAEIQRQSAGVKPEQVQRSFRDWVIRQWNRLSRSFEHLPRTAENANLLEELHRLQKNQALADLKSMTSIQTIIAALDLNQYDLFSNKLFFDDLLEDVELWRAEGVSEEAIEANLKPWKIDTVAKAEEIKRFVDGHVAQDKTLQKALQQRKATMDKLKKDYFDLAEAVGFNAPGMDRKAYYRHQVLDYYNKRVDQIRSGTRTKRVDAKTVRGAAYAKARTEGGAAVLYNTEYVQAEYEWIAEMLKNTQIFRVLKEAKAFDISEQVRAEALRANQEALEDLFEDKAAAQRAEGKSVTGADLLAEFQAITQTRGFAKLGELAFTDNLPIGEEGEYKAVVDELAQWQGARKQKSEWRLSEVTQKAMPDFVKYLKRVAKDDKKVQRAASAYVRQARKQNQQMRDELGRGFTKWTDHLPDGYRLWQPESGSQIARMQTLPEHLAKLLQKHAEGELKNIHKELGKLVKGLDERTVLKGPREFWVLPNEVADTLDAVWRPEADPNSLARGFEGVSRFWKGWNLLAPHRAFGYNFGNFIGDAEAIYLGNPQALKHLVQKKTWKEIGDYLDGKPVSEELMGFLERGGVQQTFGAIEGIASTDQLKKLNKLLAEKGYFSELTEQNWKELISNREIKQLAKQTGIKIWSKAQWVRKMTDWRELSFRYAAYRSYLEQIQGNGKPSNYGASIPEVVDAIKDPKTKAYKLANDLLGAYDETSVTGTELARYAMPFWRWQEIQLKRYTRLIRNVVKDPSVTETLGLSLVPKASVMVARRAGALFVKAMTAWTIMSLWNNLTFSDEEEKLPEHIRNRPHLILGVNEGKPIVVTRSTLLTDLLDWVGWDENPGRIRDVLDGRKDFQQVLKELAVGTAKGPFNRLYQQLGVGNQLKEIAMGKSGFPDLFNGRDLRDRFETAFKSYGLYSAYDVVMNRPDRGPLYEVPVLGQAYNKVDPGDAAMTDIWDLKNEFLHKLGKAGASGNYSDRGNAAYWLKKAATYGDKRAFEKYLLEYVRYGGTGETLEASLESSHPLSGLNEAEQEMFKQSLHPKDRERLARAEGHWATMVRQIVTLVEASQGR